MANSVATVASLEGQAWAKTPDGKLRPLKVGDTVTAEEVVVTATGARIELDFGDGHPVAIAGGQEVLMNRDLWTDLAADDKDAAVQNASVEEALTVLNNGGDLTTVLEETAAGLDGGGASEGHSFVELTRVVEQTDPNAFDFGTTNGDGGGATTAAATAPSNNAPLVADGQGFTGDEDTIISGRVIATDVENDTLTYTITGQPANGVITLDPATGDFIYTPNVNYNGPDSFVITVTDDHGNSTTSTIGLSVTAVNDAPVTNNQNLTTPEDTPVSGQVVATDVENDTLTYSVSTNAAHGTVTLNAATGGFTYTPNADFNGSDSFIVTVNDGNGGTTTSTITIGVTPVNDAPVSNDQNLTTDEDTPLAGAVVATDVDNDTLSYSVTTSAAHGSVTINAATGEFVYTPSANYNGADSFVVTIADGQGGVTTSTINIGVNPVNDAPDTGNQNLTTLEDTPVSGQVVATDVEGDTLSYSITTSAAHGTVTIDPATGGFVYTPAANYNGPDQFVVSVSDGNGGVSTSTINIGVTPVNDAPVTSDQNLSTPEDTAVSGSVIATDVDLGDVLTYSITSNAGHGSVTLDPATGSFIYTPTTNYNGSDSFVVTVSDGKGGTTTSTININVSPANDAPVTSNLSLNTNKDTPVNGSVSASDPDGDPLSFSVSGSPGHGSVTLNAATGTFTYTPSTGYTGGDSFVVTVSDGHGGTTTSTVSVGVQAPGPVNTAPTAVADSASTSQDTAVTVAVRSNDTDPEGDTLTVSGVTQGANGSVVIDAITGNPIYTPNSGYTGTDTFSYTINDGNGHTSTATVSVTVNPVAPSNLAPTAVTDTVSTTEDNAVTVAVRSNDTDPNVGDTLTVSAVTQGANGSVVIDAGTGNPIYTPNANFSGTDSFTYTITDSGGLTSTATVNVTVTAQNDAPVNSVPATQSLTQDTSLVFSAGNGNAISISDVDAGSGNLEVTLNASNGLISLSGIAGLSFTSGDGTSDGSMTFTGTLSAINSALAGLTFTPTAGYNGSANITITTSDLGNTGAGGALTDTDTINLTVTPLANLAPQTNAVTANGTEDSAVTINLSGTDADGSVAGYIINNLPANGVLYSDSGLTTVINAGDLVTGPVYFNPASNWNGSTSFSYSAQDNLGLVDASPATVSINVAAAPDAAVLSAGTGSVKEDTPAQASASGTLTITDPDAGESSFVAQTNVAGTYGSFSIDTAGAWTYSIDNANAGVQALKEGETKTEIFSVSSADNTTTQVTITVKGTNDAPVAVADTASVNQDAGLTLTPAQLLGNDTDVDGDTLSITSVQGAVNGTVSLVGGNAVFTPTAGYSGSASFTYTVTDGISSSTATVNVTVIPAAGTLTLSATSTLTEAGGNITYTATLTNPQSSDLTVNLANGEVITITAGQLTGTVVKAVANSDDVYIDPSNITNSISSTSGGNAGLAVNSSSVSTSITDTADTTTVSLSASGTVAEGGSIVYTATLTNPAQGAVTVNLSNGSSITIANGATTGSVTVAAPTDDVYLSAGNVSVTINNASGGNFENLAVNPAPAVTAVSDTNNTTTLSLTGAGSINEGASGSYTLSLTNPAQTAVTVTLNYSGVAANGSDISGTTTVTIAANSSSTSFNISALTDGLVEGPESFTVSIASANGGNFETLAISGVANSVTTNIVDVDFATVSLSATSNLTEAGGTLVYTATINTAPLTDLTVNLSNGETITILAGQTTGTKSITVASSDDVYVDPTTISATITGTSGGGMTVNVNPAAAVTNITDTTDTTTLSLGASASVAEGGLITYTATLTSPAQGAVTVNLSNGSSITILDGATSGSVSVAAPTDDVYVSGSVSATITGASGGNFENLVTSPTPAVTTITDDGDTTTVSLSASGAVAEGGSIVYTATLTNPAQGAVTVNLSNGSSITIANGATTGSVTVAAPTDDVYLSAGNVSVTINSASGGNFENLAVDPAPAVTAVSDTTDITTLSLTGAGSITEGASGSYTLSLTNPAQTAVTVTLNYSGVAANGSDISGTTTVTIAANSSSTSFNISALTDGLVEGPESFTVSIASANGGNFENLAISGVANSVTTNIVDVDFATVSLSATSSLTEAGGTLVYTATINTAPLTDLTVNLSNGETITILAGQTTGTKSITVASSDDVYVDPTTISATITSTSGGGFTVVTNPAAAVTNIVDTNDTTNVTLSAPASVVEGGSILYTATLSNPAQGTVTIGLSNGSSITILNGATSGSVSVNAPTDDVYVDAGSVSVTLQTISGGNFENAVLDTTPTVTSITDTSDITGLSLAATNTVNEGGSITYTATLTNPAQGAVTVNLSNGSSITILNGATTGTVTVAAPVDDANLDAGTVSAHIVTATGGNFESLSVDSTPAVTTVNDTIDTTNLTLSAPASVAEGGMITYTATLTHPTQGALTVTLSNGATIIIANGATSGSTSFAAPTDDVYVDAGSVSVTIAGTTGGNFENLVSGPVAVVTAITDTSDTTTISLTGAASISEGSQATYTLSLTHPAQTAVTVNLTYSGVAANGTDISGVTTVTIPVNGSSATFDISALTDGLVEGTESFTVAIGSVTGGNFENLVVSGSANSVTTNLVDADVATVSLSATSSLTEAGGTITYTATITSAPVSNLQVSLSNGSVITILAGQTSGSTAVVIAGSDDVYVDPSSVSATISGTSGGGINLAINPTPAVTSIVDTLDTTTITLGAASAVNEGGSIVYSATVNNAVTDSPLVIHLNNGVDITIPVGLTSGNSAAVPVRADDSYAQGNQLVSVGISSTSGGNFEALNTTSTVSTTVSDNGTITAVTLTAAGAVTEGGSVVYTANVGSNVTGSPLVIHLSNGVDITIPVGLSSASSAAVPVRADDAYIQGNQTLVVGITGTAGGNYENLNTSSTASTVVSDSNTPTTVTLTAAATVNEGGSIVYTASVNNAVTGSPLVIHLDNGVDITIPVNATSANSVAVPVRVDDAYAQGTQSLVVGITSTTGGNYESLNTSSTTTTQVSDDGDVTAVTLSAATDVNEGGSVTYTATVGVAVTGSPLVIHLDNGVDITIPVGDTSATSAAVPVRADDTYAQGDQTLTVGISSTSGGLYEALNTTSTVSTIVHDDGDITTVTLSAAASVVEGTPVVYTATVNNTVTDTPFVIHLSNGVNITIPVGETSATGSLATRIDDNYTQGPQSLTATITSTSGGKYEALNITSTATTVVNDDLDVTTLNLTGAASVREGENGSYTLTLSNPALTATTVNLNYSGVAANGADFTGTTSVTISAGSTTASFNIAALTDSLTEGNETFTVSVGTVTGGSFESLVVGTGSVTTTIVDNRAPVAANDPTVNAVSNSGLLSKYYSYVEGTDGTNLGSIAQVIAFVATKSPDATFIATKFDYGALNSFSNNLGYGTNLQTFLGADAASLSNDPGNSSDAIIHMHGYVNLAAGTYNFKILADDGYLIKIDGVAVAQVNANQSPTGTVHSQFTVGTSGYHSIEIYYWDQGGQAVFKAELSDNNGATYNLLSTVPTSHNSVYTINEDTDWTVSASQLLTNDTDADGDTLSIISVQGAVHGTVQMSAGNITFTPEANYSGMASYTYTISDGHGGTSTATVSIEVLAVNDAPTAVNDTGVTGLNTALTIPVATLMANDSDIDGNTVSIASVQGATNGTVSLSGSNVIFTPATNFEGVASFTYTLRDSVGATSNATVNVTVGSATAPSVVVSKSLLAVAHGTGGTSVKFPIITKLVDTDGSETLSIKISGVPTNLSFNAGVNLGGGVWQFTSTELDNLTLNLPGSYTTTATNLTVQVTSTEINGGFTASTSAVVTLKAAYTTVDVTTTESGNYTGSSANEFIQGGGGDNTINASNGNNIVYGGAGNDNLSAGSGSDVFFGGAGDDTINAGSGTDRISGGSGNDTLRGGDAGENFVDVFAWSLGDQGASGTPAIDTIQNFSTAAAGSNTSGGDVLDLRDLLQGESVGASNGAGNLANYLHFEVSGGNTIVHISHTGGFSADSHTVGGSYTSGAETQQIVLSGVNLQSLYSGATTDAAIITQLLNNNKLITD